MAPGEQHGEHCLQPRPWGRERALPTLPHRQRLAQELEGRDDGPNQLLDHRLPDCGARTASLAEPERQRLTGGRVHLTVMESDSVARAEAHAAAQFQIGIHVLRALLEEPVSLELRVEPCIQRGTILTEELEHAVLPGRGLEGELVEDPADDRRLGYSRAERQHPEVPQRLVFATCRHELGCEAVVHAAAEPSPELPVVLVPSSAQPCNRLDEQAKERMETHGIKQDGDVDHLHDPE